VKGAAYTASLIDVKLKVHISSSEEAEASSLGSAGTYLGLLVPGVVTIWPHAYGHRMRHPCPSDRVRRSLRVTGFRRRRSLVRLMEKNHDNTEMRSRVLQANQPLLVDLYVLIAKTDLFGTPHADEHGHGW
jgi:hypothetical protein